MSETLNNTNENINHGGAEGYWAPPFDPAAADAARREEINKTQLEQAPGTIVDPDKAQAMAEAGNFDETEAAKFEKYAKEASSPREESDYRMYAKISREDAEEAEAEAEREYDAEKQLEYAREHPLTEARREEMNRIQLEQAPGTIVDPDKAHAMAKAGNYYRSEAAGFAKSAEEASDPKEKSFYELHSKISGEWAEENEAEAEKEYDAGQNLKLDN